jgi:Arc/MetJ family transcription regulator
VSRTNVDIDDELVAGVMRRYGLSTKGAVDFALRQVSAVPMATREMHAMRRSGWGADLGHGRCLPSGQGQSRHGDAPRRTTATARWSGLGG